MKGFEIKRENEKTIYLFNRFDVVSAIAHAIYYTANPESKWSKSRVKMDIPNCVYEKVERMYADWNKSFENCIHGEEEENEISC